MSKSDRNNTSFKLLIMPLEKNLKILGTNNNNPLLLVPNKLNCPPKTPSEQNCILHGNLQLALHSSYNCFVVLMNHVILH